MTTLLIDAAVLDDRRDREWNRRHLEALVRRCGDNGVDVVIGLADGLDRRAGDPFRGLATLDARDLVDGELARFSSLDTARGRSRAILLHALDQGRADFLVTEDARVLASAEGAELRLQTFRLNEALSWLDVAYGALEVALPAVRSITADELDRRDPIFVELREDYAPFDAWLAKAQRERRDCWVITQDGRMAGLVIRKDENRRDSGVVSDGTRILKACTFKVAAGFRGRKFGELLLKQLLWHAQLNGYDVVYLTAFRERQEHLETLLTDYGFVATKKNDRGETYFEKVLADGPVEVRRGETTLAAARRCYPRFPDGEGVRKFIVPILPAFHARLFPEFGPPGRQVEGGAEKPGNTIEKIYLCRSQTRQMRQGDLVFFYMSKMNGGYGRQTLTTVGVVRSVRRSRDFAQVSRLAGRRSVFSEQELEDLVEEKVSPLLIFDFLLVGHFERPVPYDQMVHEGVLRGPPQSATCIDEDRYARLKPMLDLGF